MMSWYFIICGRQLLMSRQRIFADCIKEGKPLVALHHSICAFDDWPEYLILLEVNIFINQQLLTGKNILPVHIFMIFILRLILLIQKHPVTKGLNDFEIFDETYKGYYVEAGVTPLLNHQRTQQYSGYWLDKKIWESQGSNTSERS